MACQLARYINAGTKPIQLGIGSVPGKAWDRYDADPGQVIEGPAGYLRSFTEAGFTLVTPEMEIQLANRGHKKAPIVAEQAEQSAEPAAVVVEDMPSLAPTVAAEPPMRGNRRGRSNRSSES